MALPADCSVALLPIKPIYANAIMAGTKRVEFRKTAFRRPVTHVAVYASTPVQRIIGVFSIASIDHASPAALWRRHATYGGITSEAFELYYEGTETGLAIGITDVLELLEPIPLDALGKRVTPPQSFRYLNTVEIQCLRKAISTTAIVRPKRSLPTTGAKTAERDACAGAP
jgi:predicted transcriptional regulator